MDIYLNNITNCLKNANIRMKWYEETKENRFLAEALDWISVANIYGNEIQKCNIYTEKSL